MSEKYQGSAFTGAVGLMSLLSILFLWCKITGIVSWGWAIILSPLWIGMLVFGLIVVGVYLFARIYNHEE